MKRAKTLLSALSLVFILLSCISVGVSIAQAADNKPANSVIAYYFHGNFRCQNCHNMEQWTKELMETCFKDQIDSGKLSFKIINTDKKENQHFMNDYNLYTKSIVLSLVKDGKEVRYENLAKIWDCLRSKQRFQEYVRTEIEKYLKEA